MLEQVSERRERGAQPYLSDTVSLVTLCGEGIERRDDPTKEAPALILGVIRMNNGPHYYATPSEPPDSEPGRYVGGSNYCIHEQSGHSKFTYAPIAIHDHWERPFKPVERSTAGMIPMPEPKK